MHIFLTIWPFKYFNLVFVFYFKNIGKNSLNLFTSQLVIDKYPKKANSF